MEKEQAMLPVHLFPVLAGRELVCTSSTRERFDEIVSIVASESERARAALLLDPSPWSKKKDDAKSLSPEERRSRFQDLCVHPLPVDLRFPVRTLTEQYQQGSDAENRQFHKVAMKLSQVNRGVFMTGWQQGWTTISSNRTVAKMIETWLEEGTGVEEGKDEGEDGQVVIGPDIYVVPTARSLVGKAKRIEV
jgi:hypothetical protein